MDELVPVSFLHCKVTLPPTPPHFHTVHLGREAPCTAQAYGVEATLTGSETDFQPLLHFHEYLVLPIHETFWGSEAQIMWHHCYPQCWLRIQLPLICCWIWFPGSEFLLLLSLLFSLSFWIYTGVFFGSFSVSLVSLLGESRDIVVLKTCLQILWYCSLQELELNSSLLICSLDSVFCL